MIFKIYPEQKEKLALWRAEQDKIVLEGQKKSLPEDEQWLISDGYPYYGAIGGELTYKFTPTSIGMSLVVIHAGTNATLDLTEYDNW